MRTMTAGLLNYLATNTKLQYADLYTITLKLGTVLRYTTADRKVVLAGNTFLPSGPQLKAGRFKTSVGLTVDTFDLTILAKPSDVVALGLGLLAAARMGLFDQAAIRVERLYMPTWGDTSLGALLKFVGNMGPGATSRTQATFNCKSETEKLNKKLPQPLIQPGCIHTLFDAGCTLLKASFTSASATTAVTSKKLFTASGLAQAAGYFDLGVVTWTSGPNAGLTATVMKHSAGGVIELHVPLLFTPGVGDTFTILPGCDKLDTTCNTKFGNLANNGGFKYVPVPEAAIGG
jgi:uncharacterized phage protein (TIGR02218 family)